MMKKGCFRMGLVAIVFACGLSLSGQAVAGPIWEGVQYSPAAGTLPISLVAGGTIQSEFEIEESGFIQDVNVRLDIDCSSTSALEVRLQAPSGEEVILFSELDNDGENFNMTGLDDEASESIFLGVAPYNSNYIPQQPLSVLDGDSITGTWQLTISDLGGGSVGQLNGWSASIESVPEFDNCNSYVATDPALPLTLETAGTVMSSFEIEDEGAIVDLNVVLDISCISTSSLEVKLQAPSGEMITLFSEVDNNGRDFYNTGLDDEGSYSVYIAEPPFRGTFTPGQPLSTFDNQPITGTWQLYISDLGGTTGTLNSWSLCFETKPEEDGRCVSYNANDPGLPRTLMAGGTIQSDFEIEDNGIVTDVNVLLDITCNSTSALEVKLQSPSGEMIVLISEVDNDGQNFESTWLDDEGGVDIGLGFPPFSAVYRPAEPLNIFDSESMTGTWQLWISDLGGGSFGQLNSWSLCIASEPAQQDCTAYESTDPALPRPLLPSSTIMSSFEIEEEGYIADINVMLDIPCTSTSALEVKLQAPSGEMITLFSEVDNDGQNFYNTGLDDEGAYSVYIGMPPFRNTYTPGQPLSTFDGQSMTGTWQLWVSDLAGGVAGSVNRWYLCIKKALPHPADLNQDFEIKIGEAIAYLAGWQRGSNPMAYAIRAAYIWQRGEAYTYNDTAAPPLCWELAK